MTIYLTSTTSQFERLSSYPIHTTDIPKNLRNVFQAFAEIGEVIIFPVHPRTSKKTAALESEFFQELVPGNIKIIDAVGYVDMPVLEENARLILTDSGGIQKEAYFFGVPCITLRTETEWVETGLNVVAGADMSAIVEGYQKAINSSPTNRPNLYGDGRASEKIVSRLKG